jgi:hypothetical protein
LTRISRQFNCIKCLLVQNVDKMTASAFTALMWHTTVLVRSTVSCMMERGECSKREMEVGPAPRFTRAHLPRTVACRLKKQVAAFSREMA